MTDAAKARFFITLFPCRVRIRIAYRTPMRVTLMWVRNPPIPLNSALEAVVWHCLPTPRLRSSVFADHSAIKRRHGDFHAGPGWPACSAHGAVHLTNQPLHDAAAETWRAGGLSIGLKSLAVIGKCEAMVGSDGFHCDLNIPGLSDIKRMFAGVQHQFCDQQ